MTDDREKSVYEQYQETSEGRAELAAARAAGAVLHLFHEAKSASGIKNRELATNLRITEGRVSQVINGDGNYHISTVAKFLSGMGFDLHLAACDETGRMLVDEAPARRRPRRSRKEPLVQNLELYTGLVWTSDGRAGRQHMALSHGDLYPPELVEMPTPTFESEESSRSQFSWDAFSDYQERADEAAILEEI